MNCSVSLYVHTMIQARIDLYRKAGIKLWVSIGDMHTEGNNSATVLVITWEQSTQEGLPFREGGRSFGGNVSWLLQLLVLSASVWEMH